MEGREYKRILYFPGKIYSPLSIYRSSSLMFCRFCFFLVSRYSHFILKIVCVYYCPLEAQSRNPLRDSVEDSASTSAKEVKGGGGEERARGLCRRD